MVLSEEVLNGSPSFAVPAETINSEIAKLVQQLELTPDFNPNVKFDPKIHLLHKPEDYEKTKIHTLGDLNIKKTHVPAISNFGVTEPFPLFTVEACNIMKWEAFQVKCVQKYGRLPRLAKGSTTLDVQICGYIDSAPFTRAAWTHQETQDVLDKYAGVKLEIMFDYEIAHINASLRNSEIPKGAVVSSDGGKEIKSIYDWHYDSNSFVVVLMLSAEEGMIGGLTGLKNGAEEMITIEDPKVGYASLLQGRVIRHVATKPESNNERISSVTGYIPKDLKTPDTTVMTSFRPSVLPRSIHDEWYPAWVDYRLNRLQKMIALKKQEVQDDMKNGKHFDQAAFIEFCKEAGSYLEKSWDEMESVCDAKYPPDIYSKPYSEL